MGLQSDAVFGAIKDRVDGEPAKAKSVNGVFVYKITENGKVVKEWSKYFGNKKRKTLNSELTLIHLYST